MLPRLRLVGKGQRQRVGEEGNGRGKGRRRRMGRRGQGQGPTTIIVHHVLIRNFESPPSTSLCSLHALQLRIRWVLLCTKTEKYA